MLNESQKEYFANCAMEGCLEIFAKRDGIPFEDALFAFVEAPVYEILFDFETEVWREGVEYLLALYDAYHGEDVSEKQIRTPDQRDEWDLREGRMILCRAFRAVQRQYKMQPCECVKAFRKKDICEMVLKLAEFDSIPIAEITELAVRRVNGMKETEK